ncbi:ABC transporter substrate-binding protein, partial [Bradyrhizobium sp. Y36]
MRQFRRRKRPLTKSSFMTMSSAAALLAVSLAVSAPVRAADDAVIQKWITEFQPSTLSKDDQKKELEWFAKAAEPFKGMEINIVSETIATHEYESQTLAKAFSELTGIKLKH